MPTISSKGTVTWIDPEFYVSYDNVTGEIKGIGQPDRQYSNFKVEYSLVEKFLTGELLTANYRIVNKEGILEIDKIPVPQAVNITYPIIMTSNEIAKIKLIRYKKNNVWLAYKFIPENVFLFVCSKESRRHYIRTLSSTDKTTSIPMIYDSELGEIDVYVQETYSVIEYHDE